MSGSHDCTVVYKIEGEAAWATAEAAGRYDGSAVDHADGFIHFSTADQVRETAARHFAGRRDLVLIAVAVETLENVAPGALRFEPSRGGALFPHLYAPLPLEAVLATTPLPLLDDGRHDFPEPMPDQFA